MFDPREAAVSRRGMWTKSTISTLEGCPRQFALTYRAELPVPPSVAGATGTAVHAALETHEAARISGDDLPDLEGLGEVAAAALAEQLPHIEWWDGKDEASLRGEVEDALLNWWGADLGRGSLREVLSRYEPAAVELAVTATPAGVTTPLGGTLDWVGFEAGTPVIVDHKTAGKLSKWPATLDEDRERELRLEAAHYALGAIEMGVIDRPPLAEYHVMRTSTSRRANFVPGRLYRLALTDDDLQAAVDRAAAAEEADDGRYLPNPGFAFCSNRWCPFFSGCQGSGELAGPWDELMKELDRAHA